MQRGSFQWMKTLNKSIILNKIRTGGPISRAQIAKDTKLTPPTVSSIVKELIEQGIVRESAQGTSQGGRKPTMLIINSTEFYIIGIDAGPRTVKFVLADLSGELKEEKIIPIDRKITGHQFINILVTGIKSVLSARKALAGKIAGIGVAMHGVVKVEEGVSEFAPNLDLHDVAIKEELEKAFDYEVKVENDARAMALGEAWFGDSEGVKSMLALNIGSGIGAGLMIDGKLYHGEYDLAGEIGHMTLDVNGEECTCGNNGCLQTVASGPAIEKRAKQLLAEGRAGGLASLAGGNPDQVSGELVYQAAVQGDKDSKAILEETGTYIGIGLTNLIHVINPSKIVIGGGVSSAGGMILQPIKQTIKARALTNEAKQTEIAISPLQSNATVLGAVALVLTELFDPLPRNSD
ncbi:ROK family transcriptional regulator [Sediminibacillus halophilus]|uniref:ROK family protein (Putative glucokinase) n=1 Tax=Sediminibacillus halophilus TaxID=482461 RepID=A0A1G9TKZ2_9BACI|nr:ROK family transcriptional regulator [Sediminibacillus halophilus]SDM48371.1 ROK family protein (putative glucokinase) [Sediminibacillus halophilus]